MPALAGGPLKSADISFVRFVPMMLKASPFAGLATPIVISNVLSESDRNVSTN